MGGQADFAVNAPGGFISIKTFAIIDAARSLVIEINRNDITAGAATVLNDEHLVLEVVGGEGARRGGRCNRHRATADTMRVLVDALESAILMAERIKLGHSHAINHPHEVREQRLPYVDQFSGLVE